MNQEQGKTPPPPKPAPKPKPPKRTRVKAKDREYFTTNLAMLMQAGVPITQALDATKQSVSSKQLHQVVDGMIADIDSGASLTAALDRSGLASTQTLTLVRLGEQAGSLAGNLQVASVQEQKQRAMRSKVQTALLYPAFVLGMTAVVGLGVAWFLLPQLAETFVSLDTDLPTITKIFLGFGTFLKENGVWFVPLLIALVILGGTLLLKVERFKTGVRSMLLHFPGIGKLLKESEIAPFGSLLGMLLEAGLSVTESLKLLSDTTETRAYRKLYSDLHQSIEDGYSFAASFQENKAVPKLLPPGVQQMVIAGEKSGALPQSLKNIGDVYEKKTEMTVANLQTLLEPILLVIVWIGVLGLAIAVILPIYSLVGGLE